MISAMAEIVDTINRIVTNLFDILFELVKILKVIPIINNTITVN